MVDNGSPSLSSCNSDNGSVRADALQPEAVSSPNVSTNPKPTDYKMGNWICRSQGSDWYIVTGGKPLAEWSGLDPTEDPSPFSPSQIRQASTKARSSYYAKRIAPMETKFKQGMNLCDFMQEVATHNDEHGLTTWHYLHHPASNTTKMLLVVTHYTKFINDVKETVDRALKLSKEHYNEFDQENSKAAATYLINSLDPDFKSYMKLMMIVNDEHNFICVWVRILSKVLANSSKSIEQTKAQIRGPLPSSSDKEGIEKWHKALTVQIESLQSSNSYDHTLTETVLQNAAEHCSVKEGFNFHIHQLLFQVRPVIRKVKHTHNLLEQEREMARQKLDIKTILLGLINLYNELRAKGNWAPAKLPTNRNALKQRGAYLAITNQSVVKTIAKEVAANLALSQSDSQPKKKGSCYNCGDPGHWANKCPHPKKKRDDQKDKKKPGNRNPPWIRTPPNQEGIETHKYGKTTYYWCAKCRKWNLHHATAEHCPCCPVGSDDPVASPCADLALASNCEMHPAIWAAITGPDSLIIHRHSQDNSNDKEPQVDPFLFCIGTYVGTGSV